MKFPLMLRSTHEAKIAAYDALLAGHEDLETASIESRKQELERFRKIVRRSILRRKKIAELEQQIGEMAETLKELSESRTADSSDKQAAEPTPSMGTSPQSRIQRIVKKAAAAARKGPLQTPSSEK